MASKMRFVSALLIWGKTTCFLVFNPSLFHELSFTYGFILSFKMAQPKDAVSCPFKSAVEWFQPRPAFINSVCSWSCLTFQSSIFFSLRKVILSTSQVVMKII